MKGAGSIEFEGLGSKIGGGRGGAIEACSNSFSLDETSERAARANEEIGFLGIAFGGVEAPELRAGGQYRRS